MENEKESKDPLDGMVYVKCKECGHSYFRESSKESKMNDEKEVQQVCAELGMHMAWRMECPACEILTSYGKAMLEKGQHDGIKIAQRKFKNGQGDFHVSHYCITKEQYWNDLKLKDEEITRLKERLSEQEKRAFEYHAEWESACLRERGRIEDVKDLESRLKEAEKELENYRKSSVLPECPMCGKMVAIICPDDLEKLRKRLSQAEAEAERLAHTVSDQEGELQKVMDVAVRMSSAIKAAHRYCMDKESFKLMESCLAEWDGIKEGGK